MQELDHNLHTAKAVPLANQKRDWLGAFVRLSVLTALFYVASLLTTCSQSVNIWEQIQSTGKIRVVTRDNPATFYFEAGEAQGFEYDLIKRFAEQLGVTAEIYNAPVSQIINDVQNGRAQIAAAGLTVTPARQLQVHFGPVYQEVEQLVIGRRARGLPKKEIDLLDAQIGVLANSSHVDRLVQIKQSFPELSWIAEEQADTMSLLRQVKNKTLDLTILDSNEFAVAQRYFPELARAFTLSEPQTLAWAITKNSPELHLEIDKFFANIEASGEIDTLKELHFGFVQAFDFVELVSFMRDYKSRLPEYKNLFKLAARTYNLDWKFIAAIAYQESRWKADAVSATGVKGLMMLTNHAAEEMNLSNREDPAQSIAGGTRYFLRIRGKIPERIQEPDRTWLALAGYNVGFGHLEDARVLTQRAGKNPDVWKDVREHLPLLEDKEYYSTVRRGKARGSEPVKYVDNIRDFYDLLKFQERSQPKELQSGEDVSELVEINNNETDVEELKDTSDRSLLRQIFSPEIFTKD